jgi:hypothetical protein
MRSKSKPGPANLKTAVPAHAHRPARSLVAPSGRGAYATPEHQTEFAFGRKKVAQKRS